MPVVWKAPANRGGEVQDQFEVAKTLQNSPATLITLCKVYKSATPLFCDIPHEETHFAVTVDFQTALAIRLISDFVIAQCFGFEFSGVKT